MITLHARNVNVAYHDAVSLLRDFGEQEDSRNGKVFRIAEPVTTVYKQPWERVLFDEQRDANPFFHIVEALWMLSGRDDLKSLIPYVPRMSDFSDNGRTQPGAYGHRWRKHFKRDQLDWVVARLRENPSDRRTVIQMWDPRTDMAAADAGGRDVPCNLTALPWMSDGALHLTVFCRSNDAIWGAYGANAVHFSVLLEYLAGRLGTRVGRYYQISNNFHAYLSTLPPRPRAKVPAEYDLYTAGLVKPTPLYEDWGLDLFPHSGDARREAILREDLEILFRHGPAEAVTKARWPFINRVVAPMMLAHQHYRDTVGRDRYDGAAEILQRVHAEDWRVAATEWMERRLIRWTKARDDGVLHEPA